MEDDFRVILKGKYRQEQIKATVVGNFQCREFAESIEKNWKKQIADSWEKGYKLFNGPLLKLLSWTEATGTLQLELQKTDFQTFSFTNAPETSLEQQQRADPLGNSVLVETRDNKVILGLRSQNVFRDKGRYHCIGGHLDHTVISGNSVDTFASIKTEIFEELHVREEHILQLLCLGIVRDLSTMQPEQIFSVKLTLEAAEIAMAGEEHQQLIVLEKSRKSIKKFISENAERIVPVARGALSLCSEFLCE